MECYVHPTIDYTSVPAMLKAQKTFVQARIQAVSQRHIVYPGLDLQADRKITNPAEEIQGVKEAGWTAADCASAREADREWSSLVGQVTKEGGESRTHWTVIEGKRGGAMCV